MKTIQPFLEGIKVYLVGVLLVAFAAGCVSRRESRTYTFESTGHAGKRHVFAHPEGAVAPAVVESPPVQVVTRSENQFDLRTRLVEVATESPATASVGQTLENTITVNPLVHVGDVVLTHYVASGAEFVKADPPPASVSGQKLVWNWNELKQGEKQRITVWTRPTAEGSLRSCSTIHALPFGCVVTKVGKPSLTVEKSGPAVAQLGEQVTYNIVVRNTGTSTAERVEVKDTIPAGMSHESGKRELVFDAGDLKPGDAKQASVTLTANQRGTHENVVVASSPNAGSAQAKATTKVVQPGIKIVKTGPPQQFLGKTANYEIKATQVGDTTLTGVTVTDQAPANARIDGAPGAQVEGNQATWTVGSLEPGGSKSFTLGLRASEPGVTVNRAGVTSAEGPSDKAEAQTLWRGFAAVLVEMVDDPDPLLVGESTTYTLKVTNQGTAEDRDVKVVVKFPAQITPTAASGITQGGIEGSIVTFAPLASIAPKQVATWTIRAKAAAVGDGRVSAEITTALLNSRPVTEVEATQVY
jgi:uncharacterized repeat protein (TIGR01451 family)